MRPVVWLFEKLREEGSLPTGGSIPSFLPGGKWFARAVAQMHNEELMEELS